jgi:hypothetical protein
MINFIGSVTKIKKQSRPVPVNNQMALHHLGKLPN